MSWRSVRNRSVHGQSTSGQGSPQGRQEEASHAQQDSPPQEVIAVDVAADCPRSTPMRRSRPPERTGQSDSVSDLPGVKVAEDSIETTEPCLPWSLTSRSPRAGPPERVVSALSVARIPCAHASSPRRPPTGFPHEPTAAQDALGSSVGKRPAASSSSHSSSRGQSTAQVPKSAMCE